ncbi:MAG: DUF3800 domain-containing protein [Bacteroidota bacterium]
MHLLYLDDSGSPANADETYLVLGGISVYESQADYLSQQLEELALKIQPTSPQTLEFHASEIYAGTKEPWKSMRKEERKAIIRQVLTTFVESYDTARAFACAVKKIDFVGSDPMELAFEDLCSRFNIFLLRGREQGKRDRGLIILDESSYETTLLGLAKNFRIIGTRWGVIKQLADTPLFATSTSSRLIQIADHIAYAVFRRYNSGDTSYFDISAHRFDAVGGIIHGLSHKTTSDRNCTCPACLTRRAR